VIKGIEKWCLSSRSKQKVYSQPLPVSFLYANNAFLEVENGKKNENNNQGPCPSLVKNTKSSFTEEAGPDSIAPKHKGGKKNKKGSL
jgi:hypothetical protein